MLIDIFVNYTEDHLYMERVFLWVGALAFLVIIGIFFRLEKKASSQNMPLFPIMLIVPTIALFAYIGMALDLNFFPNTHTNIEFIRYVDWIFTTPLLLYMLSRIALQISKKSISIVAALIVLDLFMIITGGLAGLFDTTLRIVLFTLSSLAFIGILVILIQYFNNQAQQKSIQVQKYYSRLSRLLIITWSIYPIIWILSASGFWTVLDLETEVLLYMILDIFAKGLFGYFLLSDREALVEAVSFKAT